LILVCQSIYPEYLLLVLLTCCTPASDARKKEIYTAFYHADQKGGINRVSRYMVTSPDRLCALITEPTLFIGDGTDIYEDFLREKLGEKAIFASSQLHFPRAATIGFLAISLWEKKEFLDPASAVPIYVRASDAELNFNNNSAPSKDNSQNQGKLHTPGI